MIEGMLTFKTISEFYDADPQGRRRSEEADYGVFWRMRPFPDYWRVSYIRNIGEVYGVHLSGRDDGAGPVVVLGTFPPDAVTDRRGENRLFYRTLERWLDGWPQECGSGPNSLLWLKERLDSAAGIQFSEETGAPRPPSHPELSADLGTRQDYHRLNQAE